VPNITPDPETGIGKWTDAEIVVGLRDGKRPDGSIIGPPMPIAVYRQMSDHDAEAIAVYLLSLKPTRNALARSQYKVPLPPNYGSTITHVDDPVTTDKVAYGSYLVSLGHCVRCHTPPGDGKPFNMSLAYSGGREFPSFGQIPASVSRNITPDPEQGIAKWSDDDIKRAITTAIRPDGTKLAGPMPYDWYAKMTPGDLDAIVAFMRTIKPIKSQDTTKSGKGGIGHALCLDHLRNCRSQPRHLLGIRPRGRSEYAATTRKASGDECRELEQTRRSGNCWSLHERRCVGRP
jgi:cytochrome c553